MTDRLFKPSAQVSVWRDTIPTPTKFLTKPLTPGEQIDITALRIKFKIERGLTKAPNQCDIEISNLAEQSRVNLETRPLSVLLQAGYDGELRELFLGDLRFGMSEQDGARWKTLMQCGDGARTYAHARVNRSYSPGTTYRQVINDAIAAMGLQVPSNIAADKSLDRQLSAGAASHGPAREELTKLLAPFGYNWSTQNGVLQVLSDEDFASQTVFPVDKEHGMIGSPSYGTPPKSGKPPHVNVKNLLYPELFPGCLIQLTSRDTRGKFRVEKVTHTGDTRARESLRTALEIKEA